MPDVEIGSVGSVDVLHDPGKVPERGLDHQVEVVAHKTIGVRDSTMPLSRLLQVGQELLPLLYAPEDVLLLIASRCHMIQSHWVLDPQRSGHWGNPPVRECTALDFPPSSPFSQKCRSDP